MLHSIAFAPDDMLASVFGTGNVRLSRISAFLNYVFPFKTCGLPVVSCYAEFDVVVTDYNPFLAAIAVRRAVEAGKSVLLVCGDNSDNWPYDLLLSRPLGEMLAALTRQEDGYEYDPIPVATRLIGEFLRPVADRITVSTDYSEIKLSRRHPSDWLALYGDPKARFTDISSTASERSGLLASLRNAVRTAPRLGRPKWGRAAIFTKELVLTGLSYEVAPFTQMQNGIDWDILSLRLWVRRLPYAETIRKPLAISFRS